MLSDGSPGRPEWARHGGRLEPDASVEEIRSTFEDELDDPSCRKEAHRMAAVIAGYGNGNAAVSEFEALLSWARHGGSMPRLD